MHVLVADQHRIMLEAIQCLITGPALKYITAEQTEQAVILARTKKPDLILMEIDLPGAGGLEAARKILERDRKTKIIMLTTHTATPFPIQLFKIGVLGYWLKNCSASELKAAIREVLAGQRSMSVQIAECLATQNFSITQNPFNALSFREFQTMFQVINANKPITIAKQFNLAIETINSIRCTLFVKLKVRNDVGLLLLAHQWGLIKTPKLLQREVMQST